MEEREGEGGIQEARRHSTVGYFTGRGGGGGQWLRKDKELAGVILKRIWRLEERAAPQLLIA